MSLREHLIRVASRAAAGLAAIGAMAALASCGGGTYQVSTFQPARVLVFGDESSRLEGPQGLKYSINGMSATNTSQIDCTQSPLWTQTVASYYGLVFANCNPTASNLINAIEYTKVGGTVDDVANSVAAFQAGDTFNYNDLVLVWVGMNDILNEYKANGAGDQGVLLDTMKARGTALASTINTIAKAGAKVIVLTAPDLSLSPFGFAESQRGDFDRTKLLSDMTTQFNLGLRINIINDGSKIGLVLPDDFVRDAVRNPGRYGFVLLDNQTYGCLDTAPLPTCTPDTLKTDPVSGSTTTGYLWADATHLGSIGQTTIGAQARDRARANPF